MVTTSSIATKETGILNPYEHLVNGEETSGESFSCCSSSCIPSRWVCDRQDDCPKGEDEAEAECQGWYIGD